MQILASISVCIQRIKVIVSKNTVQFHLIFNALRYLPVPGSNPNIRLHTKNPHSHSNKDYEGEYDVIHQNKLCSAGIFRESERFFAKTDIWRVFTLRDKNCFRKQLTGGGVKMNSSSAFRCAKVGSSPPTVSVRSICPANLCSAGIKSRSPTTSWRNLTAALLRSSSYETPMILVLASSCDSRFYRFKVLPLFRHPVSHYIQNPHGSRGTDN